MEFASPEPLEVINSEEVKAEIKTIEKIEEIKKPDEKKSPVFIP
jgi:hypothetical protein